MPVGHIFVRDTRGNVKHDDGTLALDVVSIAQSPKFLLPGGVPHVEFNGSTICVEDEGVDLYSQGGHIFFLKLSGQVPLDESCFSNSSVSDEDQLKFWHFLLRSHGCCVFGLFSLLFRQYAFRWQVVVFDACGLLFLVDTSSLVGRSSFLSYGVR
mmetsp:Transcript_12456/g.24882  ORF Transcript_12456/g.24882 Transcript_12456/m.24882 type:complete len:155 (-) Transcript_12456:59-523(-)